MDLNNLKSESIVVLGGGFGGLSTVIALLANLGEIPIILIDQNERFLFKPFLYELLADELSLWEAAPKYSALASELGFIFVQDTVVEIDKLKGKISTLSKLEIKYSQLVISTGMITDYSGVEGLKDYAYGFSNLYDLGRIKELIARINCSSECKKPLVISGAGPTGVELACKISDLVNNRIQIYLVEKGKKVLQNCKSFNREKSIEALGKRNIKIYLEHVVKSVNLNYLELSSAYDQSKNIEMIDYFSLIWTAGLQPSSLNLLQPFLKGNKKIEVNEFLQINEFKNIFFVGDIAFDKLNRVPPSAQAAMQQGVVTAQNIISLRNGDKLRPFEFESLGEMLSLGIGHASITGYGITLAGSFAFEIRRLVYLMRMPGLAQSLKSTGSWLFSQKLINSLFFQYR